MPHLNRRELLGAAGCAIIAVGATASPALGRTQPRFEVRRSPAEWRRQLGQARYAVLREGATEKAGTSALDREKRRGSFTCAGCGLPLFGSAAKFDSGTGWPSFFRAIPGSVITERDTRLGFTRTEALCRRCGGHLGHLFKDGPRPTGLRYCINGLALRFRPA